ncbi:hypothetical protein ACWEQ4_01465 [Rhodococcus sp. NPDC003994]
MSAFSVSDEHIHVLVHGLLQEVLPGDRAYWLVPLDLHVEEPTLTNGIFGAPYLPGRWWRGASRQAATTIGQILRTQNRRSVDHRYDEDGLSPGDLYVYAEPRGIRLPVEVIKAAHSYMHQACETDDWEHTEAKTICDKLISRTTQLLPSYDTAAWSIDRDTPTLAEESTAKRLTH